jgi:serpin B
MYFRRSFQKCFIPGSLAFFLISFLYCASTCYAQSTAKTDLTTTRQLATDNTAFGVELYTQLRKNEGNIIFSPYSISEAFAMLYAGAKGETAFEIARTFHISLKGSTLHTAYHDILTTFDTDKNTNTGIGFKLNIANGLWIQNGFPLKKEFVATLQNFHLSAPASLDFGHSPEKSRTTISNWVSDHTNNMIKDTLPPDAIHSLTRLVLVNTVYFDAKWDRPFNATSTRELPFYRPDSTTVAVPMMRGMPDSTPYTAGVDWQAVQLSYKNTSMAMFIILPRPGKLLDVERMLSAQFLASLDDSLRNELVMLSIPKFKYNSPSLDLKETLNTLGMRTVFTDKADLSGICDTLLWVDKAIHKAMVAVDEEGTIAAAATVLSIKLGNASPNYIEFTADRPFIFLIRDTETGMMLFMGRVVDPSRS